MDDGQKEKEKKPVNQFLRNDIRKFAHFLTLSFENALQIHIFIFELFIVCLNITRFYF